MVMVIYGSHKFKVNPDNVATPLAASIGDIVSNTVLAVTAQYMYEQIRKLTSDTTYILLLMSGIVSLGVVSGTADHEVLGPIPGQSNYWFFLSGNSH